MKTYGLNKKVNSINQLNIDFGTENDIDDGGLA